MLSTEYDLRDENTLRYTMKMNKTKSIEMAAKNGQEEISESNIDADNNNKVKINMPIPPQKIFNGSLLVKFEYFCLGLLDVFFIPLVSLKSLHEPLLKLSNSILCHPFAFNKSNLKIFDSLPIKNVKSIPPQDLIVSIRETVTND